MSAPESKTINLWSCLVRLDDEHRKDQDVGILEDASEFVEGCSKWGGFGSELSLEVDQFGNWKVRVFSHESSNQEVELLITKFGHVRVNRRRESDGILDVRNVSF